MRSPCLLALTLKQGDGEAWPQAKLGLAIVPFEASGKRSAEAIANSELVVIAGGPHGINASHAQAFNDALLQFLGK